MGAGCLTGGLLGALLRKTGVARPAAGLLRPPGAGTPSEFQAACIRCGQCVEACPYDVLHLATDRLGPDQGTPYVRARETPCNLCQEHESLLCVDICPTTALKPVGDVREIRMGVAEVIESTCYAFNRVVCRTCWHACPFPNEAIRLTSMLHPEVDPEICIGCGLCEHACPTEETSIRILPTAEPGAAS